MAQLKDKEVEGALCHLFPSPWLKEQARQTGMVKRERKINPVAFFWTLLLGFGIGKERDLASLRRAYESATGTILEPHRSMIVSMRPWWPSCKKGATTP